MSKVARQSAPAWRFSLVMLLLAGLAALLVWRVLSLQVIDSGRGRDFLQGQGDARTIRTERVPAYRGVISDRNGEPLAVSTPVASVWINPRHMTEDQSQWRSLAKEVGLSFSELKNKVNSNAGRGRD